MITPEILPRRLGRRDAEPAAHARAVPAAAARARTSAPPAPAFPPDRRSTVAVAGACRGGPIDAAGSRLRPRAERRSPAADVRHGRRRASSARIGRPRRRERPPSWPIDEATQAKPSRRPTAKARRAKRPSGREEQKRLEKEAREREKERARRGEARRRRRVAAGEAGDAKTPAAPRKRRCSRRGRAAGGRQRDEAGRPERSSSSEGAIAEAKYRALEAGQPTSAAGRRSRNGSGRGGPWICAIVRTSVGVTSAACRSSSSASASWRSLPRRRWRSTSACS